MDAGKVQFVAGASLDFHLANGFKNTDVFCAALACVSGVVSSVSLRSSRPNGAGCAHHREQHGACVGSSNFATFSQAHVGLRQR